MSTSGVNDADGSVGGPAPAAEPSESAQRLIDGSVGGPAPAAEPSESAQRLIDAAGAAFADKGFHATTTRDIAARARLSPAGVYVHFASKEDLLFHLSHRGHLVALQVITHARDSADTPSGQLVAVVSAFARWHAEHSRTARIVQYEFPHLSPEHRNEVMALRRRIDAVVRDVLEAGIASGEFDIPDLATTTLALQSLTVDVARWYDPALRRTPQTIGTAYGELALRLVRT